MNQPHKMRFACGLVVLGFALSPAVQAQYQITGGTALDANPLAGSGGLNQMATSYIPYQSYINPPSFQLTGQGLISSFSGYSPRLGPSVMQILTGRFNNTAAPVVSTGVSIGTRGFGSASITSVGPAMTVPNLSGGSLNVQQQLAPTLGNTLGPSPYASLLSQNRSGAQLAPTLGMNKFFGPPQSGDLMGGPSPLGSPGPLGAPGLNMSPGQIPGWNQLMNVPIGGAAPRGMKSAMASDLAAQYSRTRTTPELLPENDGNLNNNSTEGETNLNPEASVADRFLSAKAQAQRGSGGSPLGSARTARSSAWNPYDQNPQDTRTSGSPYEFGGTGTAGFGGLTVNPQAYAAQSLLAPTNNRPLPAVSNQQPPKDTGAGTSWLDSSNAGSKNTGTDPWRSAVEATRNGPPARPGPQDSLAAGSSGRRPGSGDPLGPADGSRSAGGGGRANPFASTLQPLDNLNTGKQETDPRARRSTSDVESNVPLAIKDDITSSTNKAEQYLRQARQALASGQFYEAIGAYSLAGVVLKLPPQDELDYLEALVAVGNFEQANGILDRIAERTGTLPDLKMENIKPASRMTMVRFLQAQEAPASRMDRRFWMGVLTINQKERTSLFRKLQIDLLTMAATATQPGAVGGFSPKLTKAVLDYLGRQLEQQR